MSSEFEVTDFHTEWLELCALATTGILEPAEWARLDRHLKGCAHCRAAFDEYQLVAREGMPLAASEYVGLEDDSEELPKELRKWDAAAASRRLLAKLDQPLQTPQSTPVPAASSHGRKVRAIALWAGVAACLAMAIGIGSYQVGKRSVPVVQPLSSPLLAKVETLSAEKAVLDKRLGVENASVVALQKQTVQTQDEVGRLQAQLRDTETQATDAGTAKAATDQQLAATVADRDSLAAKLESAQQAYQSVQSQLTNLTTQRQQDLLHYASLEVEVNDLNHRLHDAESRVTDESQYLASDRDIRELMGARQLYIADVIDMDQNGERRKPFGRVFYTKGKSLIFYAFDLDRQAGVKEVSTYQAWAREGSDNAKPISLGIFYVDSEANRRWALKTDDPKVLAQIDSVFVTVEPKGGSNKPTTKPLLYAYLRSQIPNHP
jgi:Anti-sigma-K factor rskA